MIIGPEVFPGLSIHSFSGKLIDAVIGPLEDHFSRGGLAIMSTDTLYGIGAPISDREAMRKIFEVKGRPLTQTLPIAVGDLDMIERIAVAEGWRMDYMRERLPGPFTFILPSRGLSDPMVVRKGTVAVRVPDHPLYPTLTLRVGPLALTSANPHGGPDILHASELDRLYGGSLMIIEDDRAIGGKGSEMIDLTGERPSIVRSGNLNKSTVLEGTDG